ncbi:AI-2E family transporter [Amycolatopsis thermophila]|uniref:PurR-regulated permease PerM n=1 Tax=Amycolatopsis thermophila TaxID=206084 RepID=A0ABU0F391_9PSEU|nr:AI-2E family transporter [Amycolatopsis thermophila]MDQ0382051.1 putative PurR-regulated permease PerM [Amycolatopsis thermophila]
MASPADAEEPDDLVGQPRDALGGPVADAEAVAERISSEERPLGPPGEPLNKRSPFFMGMAAAGGAAVTAGAVWFLFIASGTLVLIGVALFIAIGLEPLASWLVRRGLPRALAVAIIVLGGLGLAAGFFAALIPPLIDQAERFIHQAPDYLARLGDRSSWLGQVSSRFQLQQRVQNTFSNPDPALINGLMGSGRAVVGTLTDTLIVFVLTIYFLADFPRLRATIYRFVPHTRRPRAILIGDEIFAKVGFYVLGNVVISIIAGVLGFIWFTIFGIPYPMLLALLLAVLDLIPVVGAILAGVVVSLAALTVSWPVCLATVGFFIVYRFVEDYLLTPKIIGRFVDVPALVTVVAVVLGGVLLGIVGALVAIPVAAALLLFVREIVFHRMDHS